MSRREFQFADDQSDKFWNIELNGDTYTVNYGRSGTAGQTKEKTFESAAKAQAEHDKQIASKLKKGYAEIGSGVAATPAKKIAAPAKKAARAKATKTASNTSSVPELQRVVRTQPVDRFAITWEADVPLQRPKPKPFDLKSCEKRVRSCASGYYFDWNKARIPDSPSPEEAHFWILAAAYSDRSGKNDASSIIKRIQKVKLDGHLSSADKKKVLSSPYRVVDQILACFAVISSAKEMVEIVQSEFDTGYGGTHMTFNPSAFRRYVVPYLTSDERKLFRSEFAAAIPDRTVPIGEPSYSYHLGAAVGCHDGIKQVVASLRDGSLVNRYGGYDTYWPSHEWIVFGLPNRELVISEARRLKMSLCSKESVATWLALTELEALGVIADSVCLITNKADASRLARPIASVIAPELAPHALRIASNSKAVQVGQKWLADHPLEAAVGLVPVARRSGKLAKAAGDYLVLLQRSGKTDILTAALNHLKPDEAEWLRGEIIENQEDVLEEIEHSKLPQQLQDALESVKAAKLPTWINPAALPPIKLSGKQIAEGEIKTILSAIKSTPLAESSPLMEALKQHADPNSLDAFAWKLFETWIAMGSNSKEKWAMGAIGHLGGDGCVLNLTPLVRQWPGESQHQRAVFGLQCLRAINSETALMALNGIALKLKFKGLKEKAKQAMEEIAKSRGMTRDELADRIVPDCGLDETGSREFDFGSRQFKFVLGGEAKPMVRGADGKVRPNLPKPNKSDDPEKSEAAVEDWKILKKLLRETLKIQSERLENAMITGRRWTAENFEAFIIKHPFMVNLARQLVFAVYDPNGKVTGTFRVTEDQSIADQNDDDAELPATGSIGVVHPAHLDDPTKSAWGEVLADYGIIPPFQQLGRTICTAEAGDLKQTEITRFKSPKIPGIVMYGMLERSHWLRDTPADGGGFTQHSKYFEASDITAFIAYDPGLSIGWYDEEQQLTSIYFVKGHIDPEMWGDHKNRVKIGDVDQVVISEVLRLAHAIVSKGES